MNEILDIHIIMYHNLTKSAKLSAMLLVAEKALLVLKKQNGKKEVMIYEWLSAAISDAWRWIDTQEISIKEYLLRYDRSEEIYHIGFFDYEKKPVAHAAFTTCLYAFFYASIIIYLFSKEEIKQTYELPPIIVQTNSLITVECLEWAVKASDDEQAELAWQEKVINQLLKDHYTEEFDALGKLIGREYFEPFL